MIPFLHVGINMVEAFMSACLFFALDYHRRASAELSCVKNAASLYLW